MKTQKKPKRIGILTERMLLGFGVDLVIHKTAEGLKKRGYEVTVFSNFADDTYKNNSYKIRRLSVPAFRFYPAYDLIALRWIRKLNRENMDLFFIETFPFFSYTPFLKKPCFIVDHGVSSTWHFPLHTKINFAYMKFSQQYFYFRWAKKIITVSEFTKKELPPFIQHKAKVIYNGADHYSFSENTEEESYDFRKKIGVGEKDILLLYVGRLNPQKQPYKGTLELMEIFAHCQKRNPNIKMLMVGHGDKEDEKMIRSYGIIPYIKAPAEMMPIIYAACDLYVTASRWEGFDLPAVEAQFFGKPVVALEIGAHPEVVLNGKTGILVPSMEQIAQAINTLSQNSQQRKEMGEEARKYVTRFRWEKTTEEFDYLIREVLSQNA